MGSRRDPGEFFWQAGAGRADIVARSCQSSSSRSGTATKLRRADGCAKGSSAPYRASAATIT